MSNFTPGPWNIDVAEGYETRSDEIISESEKFICTIQSNPHDKEAQANARLIATAPEMYDILKWWIDNGEKASSFDMAEKLQEMENIINKVDGDGK